jgi:hypothetical protein
MEIRKIFHTTEKARRGVMQKYVLCIWGKRDQIYVEKCNVHSFACNGDIHME